MRMTTPKDKHSEPDSDHVKFDEERENAVNKALLKMRADDGWPDHQGEKPLPDPKSMEAEGD